MPIEKRWVVKPQGDPATVELLSTTLRIPKVLANLLVQRGIDTEEKAHAFFNPQLSDLHDPFLMKDMDRAVERVEKAVEGHEKIMVYGDYDVFQDKWYWSSNPGAAGQNGDNGENNQYARATRIKYEPGNQEADPATGYVHYRSNPDWPYSPDDNAPNLGGHALRSESFRIRAAYIYQVPESNGYVTVPGVEEN